MLMYLMYATPAARRVCSIISVITIRIIRGAAQAMTLYAILMLDRPFLDDGSLDPCCHAADDPAWLRARVETIPCTTFLTFLQMRIQCIILINANLHGLDRRCKPAFATAH
jgi:hypothetical protein